MTTAFAVVFAAAFATAIYCAWEADGQPAYLDAHHRWERRYRRSVALGIAAGVAMLASLGGWLDEAAALIAPVGIFGLGLVLTVAGCVCLAAMYLRAKGGAS